MSAQRLTAAVGQDRREPAGARTTGGGPSLGGSVGGLDIRHRGYRLRGGRGGRGRLLILPAAVNNGPHGIQKHLQATAHIRLLTFRVKFSARAAQHHLGRTVAAVLFPAARYVRGDRKSTRLNSSH